MPRATATRILVLAVLAGLLIDIVIPGNAPGIGVLIATSAMLGAAAAAAQRRDEPTGARWRLDGADLWLLPVAICLAGGAAVRSEPWLAFGDTVLAGTAATAAIVALGGTRITRGLVPAVVDAGLGAVAAILAGAVEVVADARPGVLPGPGALGTSLTRSRGARVVRGILIAAPLVVVFTVLFASADAVFASVAEALVAWRPDVDLAAFLQHATVIALVAWGAAGLFALGAGFAPRRLTGGGAAAPSQAAARQATSPASTSAPPPPPGAPVWPPAGGDRPPALPRLGAVEALTVLILLDALFAAFVGFQLAYLFGGRDTVAAAGITYADYARRGFFELVAVVVAAGTVLVGLDVLVERRSRRHLAASLVLVALTAVVLASALVRLRLYQDAYGWTELRFVVLAAIAALAVALAVLAVLLATHRTRWLTHGLVAIGVVAVLVMNAVGPGAFVAEQNLARAIDPSMVPEGGSTGLDAAYLEALGDAAVPALVRALPDLDAEDRAAVSWILAAREEALASDPLLTGWPAWNLDRARARAAISSWRAGTASR